MVAMAASGCAGVLTMPLWTGAWETVGAGLIVALFVLPAMVGFGVTSASSKYRRWRRAVYWTHAAPMPLHFLMVVLYPSDGARSDGAGDWALAFLIPTVTAEITGFLVLERWRRSGGA